MGIASLVLGIVSLVFCWFIYLAIPCGIAAVVLGIIQIVKAKKSEEPKGKGKSIAGIIMGGIGIVASIVIVVCAYLAVKKAVSNFDLSDYDYEYDWNDIDWDM